MTDALLKEALNPPQYEAATTVEGPVLVLAGAGSGKTRVLTYRIAYLVGACHVMPYHILAITFTNKAAREMRERTERLLGGDVSGMWLHTFHAACGKILRAHGDKLGFSKNFVIYDDAETLAAIKEVQRCLNIDEKFLSARGIRSVIAHCKDQMQTPEIFAKNVSMDNYEERMYAQSYQLYQEILRENDAMDFDDMILMTIKLFKQEPDVLAYYQNKFKYILVDEYQDTNRAQYEFISLLAKEHHNLCVVGDDDQSIYSFRGADISNILNFEKEYPETKVVKLEQNYRSTQPILDVANCVIANNRGRKGKKLWTDQTDGSLPKRYVAESQYEESYYIAREIRRLVDSGDYSYKDMAVLYRANALSNAVESALLRDGMPYRVYGGMKFFDRKEIKDLIAYLRVFNNPSDELALKRIVNVPKRGIGDTTVSYASDIAHTEGVSLFEVLSSADRYPKLSRAASKMQAFAASFMELMFKQDEMTLTEFVEAVLDGTGMIREYEKERNVEADAKIDNLREFLSVTKTYEDEQIAQGNMRPTLSEFLENVSLSTDADQDASEGDNKVTLMTIHSAKGLEFPVVFVIGMEETIFPSTKSEECDGGIAEERRLCYVAITRARELLYLTNARSRMLYGQTTHNLPSRFLGEIPDEYLEGSPKRQERSAYSYTQRSSFSGNDAFWQRVQVRNEATRPAPKQKVWDFTRQETPQAIASRENYLTDCNVGDRVRHKKFGDGTVTKILGDGKNKTLEIHFDDHGMKRLVLLYAKLISI
ncbi:MAG: UvrD-helicase domain-containing protein [Clostridia bacterium]|nr:UvrD-helicase domain-containing protein [Clostridia bacterium]